MSARGSRRSWWPPGTRFAGSAAGRASRAAGVPVLRGDAVTGQGLDAALEGIDVAYFLIHSMEPSTDGPFAARERTAAENFARAARAAGVQRIVYLGRSDPRRGGRLTASRQPARGRTDPARGQPLLGRAARVDRDRRRIAVVPVPRPPGRADAGARRARVANATKRARSMSATWSRCSYARRPATPAAGSRSTPSGPDLVSYGELIDRIRRAHAREPAHGPSFTA